MHSEFPGALMLDLEGQQLTDEERKLLSRPEVGGLILFNRNYVEPQQLRQLVIEVRRCNPELIIAVDQEGGRVQRFRNGFLQLPPLHSLAAIYAEDAARGRELARCHAWLMAAEVLQYGIDLSFAPVLDLFNSESQVIADRAFSADVDTCTDLARAYIAGMHEAGMVATGKHYPGHGTVVADSHLTLPVDDRSANEILGQDFQVFANCIDMLDAIMPAHVRYPAIDAECAGYSSVWIQQKLRGQLDFEGVVFSDDLSMVAAHSAGGAAQRAEKALSAGCDMVLACNDRAAAVSIADYLGQTGHPGCHALSRLRASPCAETADLYQSEKWHWARAMLEQWLLQSGSTAENWE